jgi:uncharacterized protein (DUF924 family)
MASPNQREGLELRQPSKERKGLGAEKDASPQQTQIKMEWRTVGIGAAAGIAAFAAAQLLTKPQHRTDTPNDEAVVESILELWFGGDLKANYHRKWFAPPDSRERAEIDAMVNTKFKRWFDMAERDELVSWKLEPRSFFALILMLDQFSRHVYRDRSVDGGRLEANDAKALALAEEFMAKSWHTHLTTVECIFLVMPLRHSPTLERLQYVLKFVETLEQEEQEKRALLEKFRTTTLSKLQHLQGSAAGPGGDILEKPYNDYADLTDLPRHALTRTVELFLGKFVGSGNNNGAKGGTAAAAATTGGPVVAISLSGGVDSMVLARILAYLRDRDDGVDVSRSGDGGGDGGGDDKASAKGSGTGSGKGGKRSGAGSGKGGKGSGKGRALGARSLMRGATIVGGSLHSSPSPTTPSPLPHHPLTTPSSSS